MKKYLIIAFVFVSNLVMGQFIQNGMLINDLPIPTSFDDLKKWDQYFKVNPSQKKDMNFIYDMYYFEVLLDYMGENLETYDDLIKIGNECDNYLVKFPDGLFVDRVKAVKKATEVAIKENNERKAQWAEQRRLREMAYYNSINNSSSDQRVNESNINQYVVKIEQYDQDGVNTYYRVYFTNGKSYRIRHKSKTEYMLGDGPGWAYRGGGLGGWIHVGSKERALVNAYKNSNF